MRTRQPEAILSDAEREALASCSGFVVEASDGRVGKVELPIFRRTARSPTSSSSTRTAS
jgi:hypothetical protein